MRSQEDLARFLEHEGVLRNQKVREAFYQIDRKYFAPKTKQDLAYINEAIPIGLGQTISQPYTVAFMMDLLGPEEGHKIFEVGYGSGWQTTLLAHTVGPKGHIYAMEVLPGICSLGKKNIKSYKELERRTTLICKNAQNGLPDIAKKNNGFDRIIAAAAMRDLPNTLREELKVGGVAVYPKDHSIIREEKMENGWKVREYPGFVFVPFVS